MLGELHFAPSQNEPEFADEKLVGEWAGYLPQLLSSLQCPPWCSYKVSRNDKLVGLGSFKGQPTADGSVELSYLTFRPVRGRGIATAICGKLVSIARTAKISSVIAHTLPADSSSTAVLKANDFLFVGGINDPEDGYVWRWQLEL